MQFVDLKTQYRMLEDEIKSRIYLVLEHGKYIMGPEVPELEAELRDYTGARYCLSCANGTDALQMALMAWGIGAGDAVFVPTFTYMSTAEVVSLVGATPVFVDILSKTFNMDPDSLDAAIRRVVDEGRLTPKAVIPVDLFGQCADYGRILPIARKYGLFCLEDSAQGFGGTLDGKRACTFGDISTTSFFPAKPLGCYGDGGAVFTDDKALYELLDSIRVHGKGATKYDNVRVGLNSRLDTMQAAILLPKLNAFREYELEARQRWAERYTELLAGHVVTPTLPEGYTSSWAQYSILLRDGTQREAVQKALSEKGIPTMIYYWRPLHLQVAYQSLDCGEGSLPVAESVSRRVLSLPMHPYLDDETVRRVAEAVIDAIK